MKLEVIESDSVIIGSGLASLYTALHLKTNHSIAIITKDEMLRNSSSLAQGGIAVAMAPDDWHAHIEDTLIAGCYYNDVAATTLLVKNARREIEQLIALGVEFDKEVDRGMIHATLEGGHSKRRVIHAGGDATGKVVMTQLLACVQKRQNITCYEQTMAVELLTDNNQVIGVVAIKDETLYIFKSKNVVIATGGIGGLYRHSTNYPFATGDGIALASLAGAKIQHMSLVQFHPTAYLPENSSQCFLISEAVRGEGGILRGYQYQPFMLAIDPRGDLAPRDIVARGIANEMQQHALAHISLDIAHKDEAFLKDRFPTIYDFLKVRGIDMANDLIPVTPVAHYFIGGIVVDLKGGTSVKGLYACGEAASTGVHGANRLASNSLLECLVFGRCVADSINQNQATEHRLPGQNAIDVHTLLAKYSVYEKNMVAERFEILQSLKWRIKHLMTQHVGIVRTHEGLEEARDQMAGLSLELRQNKCLSNDYFEVKHMLCIAKSVIADALSKDSMGCHYKVVNAVQSQYDFTKKIYKEVRHE